MAFNITKNKNDTRITKCKASFILEISEFDGTITALNAIAITLADAPMK